MNFRISKSKENVMNWIKTTHFSKDRPKDLTGDQLSNLHNHLATWKLVEAPITFPPTYKYDQGTQTFDSSRKQRVPSYTDRILFRLPERSSKKYCRSGNLFVTRESIQCLVYDSLRKICTSDHKPVYGLFSVTI